jgi:hypothetical protein
MAKTFMQMAAEAMTAVPGISPREAQRWMKEDPKTQYNSMQVLFRCHCP